MVVKIAEELTDILDRIEALPNIKTQVGPLKSFLDGRDGNRYIYKTYCHDTAEECFDAVKSAWEESGGADKKLLWRAKPYKHNGKIRMRFAIVPIDFVEFW